MNNVMAKGHYYNLDYHSHNEVLNEILTEEGDSIVKSWEELDWDIPLILRCCGLYEDTLDEKLSFEDIDFAIRGSNDPYSRRCENGHYFFLGYKSSIN